MFFGVLKLLKVLLHPWREVILMEIPLLPILPLPEATRCGTALYHSEVALSAQDVRDPIPRLRRWPRMPKLR